MNTKKAYSVIPIYAFAAVWLVWAILVHFGATWKYIVCLAISVVVAVGLTFLFPPKTVEKKADYNSQEAKNWMNIAKTVKSNANSFKNTHLGAPMLLLSESINSITESVAKNADLGRTSRAWDLDQVIQKSTSFLGEYSSNSNYEAPTPFVRQKLELIETAFEILARESRAVASAMENNDVPFLQIRNSQVAQAFDEINAQPAPTPTPVGSRPTIDI